MSIVKNHIKDPSSTLSTNFNYPIINDIESSESKNQTELNDNRIMNLQDDRDSGNDRSDKVLDDLLNYTLEIQRSNNPEKYPEWKAEIERVIEKTYGSDSIELRQIKDAMKLNFLTTSGQSEEQRDIYFDNLYERRFNRIETLINEFKLMRQIKTYHQ
ncbi:hypothetical protein [Candidatus Nitrosocosmicus franklandus]|uniref:Uncharacterized protein n=1 Tax=Candidatus Nitrosocosmicus franklandianus TaxID=1798806 RepID=A0A484IC97_9ARCH|nr:hypothetical protein [Candidatus Nitrosocosmicus franklandus]VFJ14720.1 protein of unknown function [Candidatus Nitrosocosmicus franklandus]